MANQNFLQELQLQAQKQSKLHHRRFLPSQLDFLTSFIGKYSWQSLLVLSLVTAIYLQVLRVGL